MSINHTVFAAIAAATFAIPAWASDISVESPYARTSSALATSGAAFMVIRNAGDQGDHLSAVSSDIADKTELHTHKENDMGVMRMLHVEAGFDVPAEGELRLARGGSHIMFFGLHGALEQGDIVNVTLHFDQAGDVTVAVPVDLMRKPDHGAMSGMKHDN